MLAPARRDILLEARDGFRRASFFAMGSPCELLAEVSDEGAMRGLAKVAANEAWRVEGKFSRYLSGNIVDRINSAAGRPVDTDSETARLIDFAASLFDLSNGRFDITSGVLRRVWQFDGGSRVPRQAAIDEVMASVGWQRVTWQPPTLTMPAGMQIDLGGIGKEYAVDRVADILSRRTDASCLINFGGDLVVTRPPQARPHWTTGIEAVDSDGASMLIRLRNGALATSGDARRFVLRNGVRYGHVLDPKTGWPAKGAPRSVTVAADTCVQAGMLSTFAMLEGTGAEAFLDEQGVKYWCRR